MGKVEDQRALREANYAARTGGKPVARKAPPTVPAKGGIVAKKPDALCGHRSVGGKTCIRAKDHDEKSHRYAKADKK